MPTKKTKTTAKKVAKKVTKKAVVKKAVPKKTAKKAPAKKAPAKKKAAPAKKAAAKKSPAKKSAGKKTLIKARGPACFWTRDGLILENLITLRQALKAMSEDEFNFHVTKDRNDFADWVEQVLGDADCAAALRKSRKPNSAATVVVRHLRYYEV